MSGLTSPVGTRGTSKAIMTHVITNVLLEPSDGPLVKSLTAAGYNRIQDVLGMTTADIDSLTVDQLDDENKKVIQVPLVRGKRGLLRAFQSYVKHLQGQQAFVTFLGLTSADFDEYRLAIYDPNQPLPSSMPSFVPKSSSAPKSNPVDDFRRGIKRDKAHYTVLKEDKQWDNWKRSTLATARSHCCEDVFDPSYKPSSADDIAIFNEKQKFIYSVFEEKLRTDMGKFFVRLHEHDYDAQTIFAKLQDHAKASTQAAIDTADLLSYITTIKLHDTKWRGTTHSFVLHWCDRVRAYEDLVDPSDHFTSNLKMTMLQNTVSGVGELHHVKVQSAHDVAHGGKPLTFEQYKTLLLSAASIYDSKKGLTLPRPQRTVNNTNLDYTDDNRTLTAYSHETTVELDDLVYDIDTDFTVLSVNETKQSTRRPFQPRMSREKWQSLSSDEQKHWDMLSPAAKATILGIGKPPPPRTPRTLDLHDISAADYLHIVSTHQQTSSNTPDEATLDTPDTQDTSADLAPDPSTPDLLACATHHNASPGDLRRVLGNRKPATSPALHSGEEITVNGKRYRQISVHERIVYDVSNHKATKHGSLIDRGANGGLAGSDVRIINKDAVPRLVDVSGIDSHQITNLPIVTVGGVVPSQRGPVIAIMHQYAYTGEGKTIHSSGQLEHYKNDVNDKSLRVPGGLQRITTNDGYVHPLTIKNGLPYVSIRPFTDEEWDTLPHVVWTSDVEWDPSVLDCTIEDQETWYDALSDIEGGILHSPFDEYGKYRYRDAELHFFDVGEIYDIDDIVDDVISDHDMHQVIFSHEHQIQSTSHQTKKKAPNYEALRPFFLYATADVIKRTFKATTQYARTTMGGMHMKNTYRSPFPALNVHRRHEPVATDTVYADEPAIDNGCMAAQIFIGRDSMVADAYPLKSEKQFVNTLEDNIRKRGAMDKLISDRAQVEISNRVHDILRAYYIDDWQSEPHYQHQNMAERRWGVIKAMVNLLLNRTGAPAHAWFLALLYVCCILNHTALESLEWRTPLEMLNGSTPDISAIVLFQFWEPVYYKTNDASFPSDSTEKLGRFVGIADHVGHALTFKVLTDDTKKVIFRSRIRSALKPHEKNLRIDPNKSEDIDVIKSKWDHDGEAPTMPTFDPSDLIGRTFLKPPEEDGQRFRAKIVEAIVDHEQDLAKNPDKVKFLCSVNGDEYEEILSYNEIIDHIEKDEADPGFWRFKSISGHQGPLSQSDPAYQGSRYNVLVDWETGESTYEPLHVIAADDPVTCAAYAKEKGLLEEEGWRRFKRIAKRQKKLVRLMNQSKLRAVRTLPIFKYGFLVPRNHEQAVDIDERNGNTKWQDAEKTETVQLDEYDTFIDKGKGASIPIGYKKIRCHFVYDVKHDGRHKARLVAGGHLTDTPAGSVYSSVVSLKGLRLVIFLAELNGLLVWGTDIGNAYLEAKTKEKVCIIAGPEFGPREGHLLLIHKALYGLRSSGLRWHERFADTLRDMGFVPSKAEDDIWMRENKGIYEYIASYVDDLCIVARDPASIVKTLEDTYGYKLKGTGPLSFHLGCNYFRDGTGTLCFAPKKYIDKMMDSYFQMFGEKPKPYTSPLERGDHPELDTSEELADADIKKYQSLIGAMQWAVTLGRIDITTAVMTMSSFRTNPRIGHMDRLKRIYGYLSKMNQAVIRIRTNEPDYSDLPEQDFDWAYSVYGNVREHLPDDLPKPLGKPVVLTTYVDANLFHDMITGRSVTGILHFVNQTPFEWYSKKQATVETATYGSEFVAARIATEQIIANRQFLRYLGVPLHEKTYMFGDNKSVVDSSSKPHAVLHKRHTALSFHRVREAIASKVIVFHHINGDINPADILSKHWGYQQIWPMLQALLFWQGDTMDLFEKNDMDL